MSMGNSINISENRIQLHGFIAFSKEFFFIEITFDDQNDTNEQC